MEAKYFVVLLCGVAVQGTPTSTTSSPPIIDFQQHALTLQKHAADFQKHALVFQQTLMEQLRAIANTTSRHDLDKLVKDSSSSLQQHLTALSTNLQEALVDANGKFREVLQSSFSNIQKSIEDLRTRHHDVPKHTEKLRDSLTAAVKSAVTETEKIAKEVATNIGQTNERLLPKIRAAYDDFIKNAQQFQKNYTETSTVNKS